jgi:K+-transporting ATPase ATPase C chain
MKVWLRALLLYGVLTVVLGVVYPLLVTGAAQLFWKEQANGSLVQRSGTLVGSERVGQNFAAGGYFWGRPSAGAYAGEVSGAANAFWSDTAYWETLRARGKELRRRMGLADSILLPADLVLTSASGLEPYISVEAARLQAGRVAAARHWDRSRIEALIDRFTEPPQWNLLGTPRVNVIRLNLGLDSLALSDSSLIRTQAVVVPADPVADESRRRAP